jgi:hypothetical protein
MRKASLRERRVPGYGEDSEDVLHYSLQGLLLPGHILALNTTLGTLSHLVCQQERPQMLVEQQCTASELCVLMPLLEIFPYYCSYEVLLAACFNNGRVNEFVIAQSRKRLHEALEEGIGEQELRPVRSVLSRTRFKTRPFGIEISSIVGTGYILTSMSGSPVQ